MTDVLYHPLIDRDTDGLDKSPLFCSPDREKVAGTAALYLEELVPKRYRLIAREEHTTRQASAYRIHCLICGAVMRAISRPSNKHRLSLYLIDRVTVYEDGRLVFRFKNGTEITETL